MNRFGEWLMKVGGIEAPTPPRPPAPTVAAIVDETKALHFTGFPKEWFSELPGYPGSTGVTRDGFQAYAAVALVYACMTFRATKLAEPTLGLKEENEDGEAWVTPPAGPLAELLALLEEPNPDQTGAELMELTSLYLDAKGRALWHKVRDGAGRVAQLYPYHGGEFTVRPEGNRLYGRFMIQSMNGPVPAPAEDVVFFRLPDPRDWAWGLSPLEAAFGHVGLADDLRKAVSNALLKSMRPGGAIETLDSFPDDTARTNFVNNLKAEFAGTKNEGKWLTLERAKATQFTQSLKDLAIGPVNQDVEAAICQVFQIHPMLVGSRLGLEANAGMADGLEPAMQLFYDVMARPRWRRFEAALTRQLLRELDPDPNLRLRFDLSIVDWLQDDLVERTTEANAAREYWTVGEARLHTGQELFGDERDDELVAKANAAPSPFGFLPPPPSGAKARRTQRDVQRLQDDAAHQAQGGLLEVLAWDQLKQDALAIAAALMPRTKGGPDEPIDAAEARRMEKDTAAAIAAARDRWVATFTPAIGHIANASVQQSAATVGVSFDLLQPGIEEFVEQETASLVTAVSETTREAVRSAIRDGLVAGETPRKIAARLEEMGAFSQSRAKLIATTEVTRARNGAGVAQWQGYQARTAVPVFKEWINSGDGKVREAHQNAPIGVGGQKAPIDGDFTLPDGTRLPYPSEPNCRCGVLIQTGESA